MNVSGSDVVPGCFVLIAGDCSDNTATTPVSSPNNTWYLGRVVDASEEHYIHIIPYTTLGTDISLSSEMAITGANMMAVVQQQHQPTPPSSVPSSTPMPRRRTSIGGPNSPTRQRSTTQSHHHTNQSRPNNVSPFKKHQRQSSFSNLSTDELLGDGVAALNAQQQPYVRRRSVTVHPPDEDTNTGGGLNSSVSHAAAAQLGMSLPERERVFFLRELLRVIPRQFALVKEARINHNKQYCQGDEIDLDDQPPLSILCRPPSEAQPPNSSPSMRLRRQSAAKSSTSYHHNINANTLQVDTAADSSKRGSVASSNGSSKRASTRPFFGRKSTTLRREQRMGSTTSDEVKAAGYHINNNNTMLVEDGEGGGNTSTTSRTPHFPSSLLKAPPPIPPPPQQQQHPSYLVLTPGGVVGGSPLTGPIAAAYHQHHSSSSSSVDPLVAALHQQQSDNTNNVQRRVYRGDIVLSCVSVLERAIVFSASEGEGGGGGGSFNSLISSSHDAHDSTTHTVGGTDAALSPPSIKGSSPQHPSGNRMKRRFSRLFGNTGAALLEASVVKGPPTRLLPPSSGRQQQRGNNTNNSNNTTNSNNLTAPSNNSNNQQHDELDKIRLVQLVAVLDYTLVRALASAVQCRRVISTPSATATVSQQNLVVSSPRSPGPPTISDASQAPPLALLPFHATSVEVAGSSASSSGGGVPHLIKVSLPFPSRPAFEFLFHNKNTTSELHVMFTPFNATDFEMSRLAELIAIHLTSLRVLSVVHKDCSAMLPYTVGVLHQRPPLWLDQHTEESSSVKKSGQWPPQQILVASDRHSPVSALSTTNRTEEVVVVSNSVDASSSSMILSAMDSVVGSPRRVVPTRDRYDSLVAAHAQVAIEEEQRSQPATTTTIPPSRSLSAPSMKKMYSTLGEFKFGETTGGGGGGGGGAGDEDTLLQGASPWRFRHRRRSTETLIESNVSVDVGIQEVINAVCFRYMCMASSSSSSSSSLLQQQQCPFTALTHLSLVNVGLEDKNIANLCEFIPQIQFVDLSHNYLRGGCVAGIANAMDRGRGSTSPRRRQLLLLSTLNLSHNEITDDDLTPLVSIITHPNDTSKTRNHHTDGEEADVVGGSISLSRLDLTFNRISHTYRTDTLAALSQSPSRGCIHQALTALFASSATGGSIGSTTTRTSTHRDLADAVLEFSNRHRKGVAILC